MTRLRQAMAELRTVVAYGIFAGLAVTVFEMGAVSRLVTQDMVFFVGSNVGRWMTSGVLIALMAHFVAPRLSPATTLPGVALIVSLGVVPQLVVPDTAWYVLAITPRPTGNFRASKAHFVWQGIFYGGLLVSACILRERADRTRRMLDQARIARSRAEASLSQAQLQALQGQIDPAFLLRVLGKVQQRYAGHRSDADRLLDDLVGFLRNAMPGVRSGTSTLAGEVAFARSYLHLLSELEPEACAWQAEIAEPVPDLPFPPLLLPPMIDRLAMSAPGPRPRRLALEVAEDRFTLRLEAPVSPGWLPDSLAYRLRVGLRTSWPVGWQLLVNEDGDPETPALTLTLPLGAAGAVQNDSVAPYTHPGVERWTTPVTTTN